MRYIGRSPSRSRSAARSAFDAFITSSSCRSAHPPVSTTRAYLALAETSELSRTRAMASSDLPDRGRRRGALVADRRWSRRAPARWCRTSGSRCEATRAAAAAAMQRCAHVIAPAAWCFSPPRLPGGGEGAGEHGGEGACMLREATSEARTRRGAASLPPRSCCRAWVPDFAVTTRQRRRWKVRARAPQWAGGAATARWAWPDDPHHPRVAAGHRLPWQGARGERGEAL